MAVYRPVFRKLAKMKKSMANINPETFGSGFMLSE